MHSSVKNSSIRPHARHPSPQDVGGSSRGRDVSGPARTPNKGPAKLERPRIDVASPRSCAPPAQKFRSLREYQDGFADRTRWSTLWPHLHRPAAPPKPPSGSLYPKTEGKRRPSGRVPAPLPKPAGQLQSVSLGRSPAAPHRLKAASPVESPPCEALAFDTPQALGAPPAAPASIPEVALVPIPEASSSSSPGPAACAENDLTTVRFYAEPTTGCPALKECAVVPSPPIEEPSPQAKSWWRVSLNRGVQRALAIGKLAADCLDLMGATLVSCITGRALIDAVVKNFRADWHQLIRGECAPPVQAPGRAHARGAELELIAGLAEARAKMKNVDALQAQKLKSLKRAVWWKGLVFATAALGVLASGAAVAANPAFGGLALALSVFVARQAYANWRLARLNLHASRHGGTPSPMGSNALAHVLHEQYAKDERLKLTPSELQLRAATRAMMVSGVSLVASVTTGGLSLAGVASAALPKALPKALSYARTATRITGLAVAPIGELVDGLWSQKASARLAKQESADNSIFECWLAFLQRNPDLRQDYERALIADRVERKVLPTDDKPFRWQVRKGEHLDLEPLVRWTRVTSRFEDLQAWMALDRATTDGPRWADRLLAEWRAIDLARNGPRWLAAASAMTHAVMSTASLAAA